MAKMRAVQVARAGGPLELVEREMPEAARAGFHHPFRPADGSRGESALGHQDVLPRQGPNGRCRIRKRSVTVDE